MKFIPNGDLIAIKKTPPKSETSAGIICTQPENRFYAKGQVAAIGPGDVNVKGWVYPVEFKIGDYVIFDKRQGYSEFGGFVLVKAQSIIAQIDVMVDVE